MARAVHWASLRLGFRPGPSFLIIGAQKAGTSALHDYLSLHPDCVPAHQKELYFFIPEGMLSWSDYPSHAVFERLCREGVDDGFPQWALDWYHSQFPLLRPGRLGKRFEASPEYMFDPNAPARIRRYRPDMKLIVLLRDPVQRAYSAWNMLHGYQEGVYFELRDPRSFEEAVDEELARADVSKPYDVSDYVGRGIYHEQLQRVFAQFPREQVLILASEDLKQRRLVALESVCRFLGIAPFPADQDLQLSFVGRYSGEMSDRARSKLGAFYAPHNEALFELLGRRFDWAD